MKKRVRSLRNFSSLRRISVFAILFLLCGGLSSCFQKFYQTNTVHVTDAATLDKLQSEHKLFIVHTPTIAFALKNVKVDSTTLSGTREMINPKFITYSNPTGETGNKMARRDKGQALNEVHFYTNSSFDSSSQVNLQISQIDRMDVYGQDKKSNRESTILSVVGITVGTAAIVGAVILVGNEMSTIKIPVNLGGN
jgi:hypothetical protein